MYPMEPQIFQYNPQIMRKKRLSGVGNSRKRNKERKNRVNTNEQIKCKSERNQVERGQGM